jgi:hypothetical protein
MLETLVTNSIKKTCARTLKIALMGIILSITSGCGLAPKHTETLNVDPAFSRYVSRFEAESADHGRTVRISDLVMSFGQVDLDGETGGRGVCAYAEGETPVITVSQEAWLSSTDAEREELVFHELGHCVLRLKHVAGVNEEGIPSSIMDPIEIKSSIYSQNRAYYLKTLFN